MKGLVTIIFLVAACSADSGVPLVQDTGVLDTDVDTDTEFLDALADTPDIEAPLPCIEVLKPALDLGMTRPNESLSGVVTLKNCGEMPASLTGIQIVPATEFSTVSGPHVLDVGGQIELPVLFMTSEVGEFSASLKIEIDQLEVINVDLVARSSDICARAVASLLPDGQDPSAPPLTELVLTHPVAVELSSVGSTSPAGEVVKESWHVVSKPPGSPEVIVKPYRDSPTLAMPAFAGIYVLELEVVDEFGHRSCDDEETRRVTIRVEQTPDFVAELSWFGEPAQSQGPDLDFHYLHPSGRWNNAPYDIFSRNRTADWGNPGPADDPSLGWDSTGWGHEILIQNTPSTTYQVGVYAYRLDDEQVTARVRIWVGGALKLDSFRTDLQTRSFWHVAEVFWPGGSVTGINQVHDFFPQPDGP